MRGKGLVGKGPVGKGPVGKGVGKRLLIQKILVVLALMAIAAGCTGELRRLKGTNQQLVAQRDSLNDEIADLKAQLAREQQSKGELEAQIAKLTADVDYWRGQAEAYIKAIEEYRQLGKMQMIGEDVMRQIAEAMGGKYIEGGGVMLASDVLFDSGKATLKAGAMGSLRLAAQALQSEEAKELHLRIDGHTDNVPIKRSKWGDNMALSQARARAVWLELRKNGVAPGRMYTAGFGEFAPIEGNSTSEGRSGNRRVEIWLVVPPAAVQVSE